MFGKDGFDSYQGQNRKPDTNFIMSVQVQSTVSSNFAEFLLENAVDGNEILAVLDDIAEVSDTALWLWQYIKIHTKPPKGGFLLV